MDFFKIKRKRKPDFTIVVKETLNNMFIVVTTTTGNVLFKDSIGQLCRKLHLELKKTSLTCELLGKYMAKKLIESKLTTVLYIKYMLVIFRFSRKIKSVFTGLKKKELRCVTIRLIRRKAHNGVRLCAKKRK